MNDNENVYGNIIEFLSQISEANRKAMTQFNFEAIEQAVNAANDAVKRLYDFGSVFSSISNSLRTQYEGIKTIASFSSKMISEIADLQASVAIASSLYDSAMIDTVAKCLADLNIAGCVEAIQDTVDKPSIIMPDYSFLKTSPIIKSVQKELVLPYGFATDMKNFNSSSAKQIANNSSLSFNTETRCFVSGDNLATTKEMNAVCSGVRFFEVIGDDEMFSENELIEFMSFLDRTPKMAMSNEIGLKILNLVRNIQCNIGFDRDEFYHSRPREKNCAPFIWSQMLKAPYGVSSIGRYNDIGQPYFYFADTATGSISEIKKHISKSDYDKYVIQTVAITAGKKVKMLDLSAKEMRGLNTFLKYLRFPFSTDSGKRPREYLIPQFVSDCCVSCGIDGIKYYGGKDYSNYVTWSDDYYSYSRNLGDYKFKNE
ncbi:MAG: RES domain-containing protein [Clostridia bacterium]|nr:RES domain-containing protein [Clostridia bacterium]